MSLEKGKVHFPFGWFIFATFLGSIVGTFLGTALANLIIELFKVGA